MRPHTYAQAGVDLDRASRIKAVIGHLAQATFTPGVLPAPGLFAGLFQLQGFREPVLVASTDGVGTKLKIAAALKKYDTVGIDLVHHCVNDILTLGARPLFFLDYIAMGRLEPGAVEGMVRGLAQACQGVGCALIGGETAEMPGVYRRGEADLVGFIVGGVERGGIIKGEAIAPGDLVLALPSSGLHTNGYSLARKVFGLDRDQSPLRQFYPQLGRTLGEALLEPHRCYLKELQSYLPPLSENAAHFRRDQKGTPKSRQTFWGKLKGLAHITGGGIEGNLCRILPPGTAARIRKANWPLPPIFSLIQQAGGVAEAEMFRVFNMGIGMAVVLSPAHSPGFLAANPQAFPIGEISPGEREVVFESH